MLRHKALFLTPGCFDKGGISRYSRYQISALERTLGEGQVRTLSLLGPTANSLEGPVHVKWSANGNRFGAKSRFVARALDEILAWKPTVIHTAHVNMSGLAVGLAKLCGARTLLNTYGLEVWSGFRPDALFGLRHTSLVMSDCHATALHLEESGLRPRGTVRVIWDCVDLTRFVPGQPSLGVLKRYRLPDPRQFFVLMTLGRVSRDAAHKGYDRLLQVFTILAQRHSGLRLVIAGGGNLQEAMRAEVRARGLADRVTFTGSIHEADLPDVYRAASLFTLISDRGPGRGEGIPLTPIEAMACGVPILVGNQDGSREAVDNERNGFVLDPLALATHVDAIERVMADPHLQRRLSAGAASVARERFSFEAFCEKHRDLYASL